MTEPPPTLEQDERFSPHLVDFVNQSLTVSFSFLLLWIVENVF